MIIYIATINIQLYLYNCISQLASYKFSQISNKSFNIMQQLLQMNLVNHSNLLQFWGINLLICSVVELLGIIKYNQLYIDSCSYSVYIQRSIIIITIACFHVCICRYSHTCTQLLAVDISYHTDSYIHIHNIYIIMYIDNIAI